MWAERFTRESTNLQDLEDAITGRIGSSLKIELVKAEVRHIADSLAADHNPLDERLHAMALVIGPPTQEKYLRARQYIEESLEKDQNSAESWTYLATLLLSDYLNGWNNATLSDVDRAEEAYKRALAIDPSFAAAHYAAGLVHRVHGDHDSALIRVRESNRAEFQSRGRSCANGQYARFAWPSTGRCDRGGEGGYPQPT